MELHQVFATKNRCYQLAIPMNPRGIMVHSTGANNPYLRRYVQPDDGLIGVNPNGNSFNEYKPGGKSVLVHAFIGKKLDGGVATYQVCPWEWVTWHSGRGVNGAAYEMGYIGFEICEDGLDNPTYFHAVYREAVELCAYLCRKFRMTEADIICHSEGHRVGIASNHGDVMHWFPRFGKSMNTFREDVRFQLGHDLPVDEGGDELKEDEIRKIVADEVGRILKGLSPESCFEMRKKAAAFAKTLPEPEWSVREGHWHDATVAGVVDGTNPEGYVSRAEAVAMIGRTVDGMADI